MVRKVFLLFLLFVITFSGTGWSSLGPSMGHEESKSKSIHKEKGLSVEASKEKKQSQGEKVEKGKQEEIAKSLQETAKRALSRRKDRNFQLSLGLQDILFPVVADLERQGVGIFGECKLVTRPPRLQDLGINWEIERGMIDVYLKEYYENKASQGSIAEINENEIKRITYCALQYAVILGTAGMEIKKLIETVGNDWLGYVDLVKAARIAILKALKKPDRSLQENMEIVKESFHVPCTFRGKIDSLLCGGLTIDVRPRLTVWLGSGMQVYGDQFMGIKGGWTVSSAWSLDRAFEKLVSNSKTKKITNSVAKYVDKLEVQGKVIKASILKKKALEAAQNGKTSFFLSFPY